MDLSNSKTEVRRVTSVQIENAVPPLRSMGAEVDSVWNEGGRNMSHKGQMEMSRF